MVGDDAAELRQRLVADWWAARDLDGAVMIAERRVHVDDLNGRAHALMRASGRARRRGGHRRRRRVLGGRSRRRAPQRPSARRRQRRPRRRRRRRSGAGADRARAPGRPGLASSRLPGAPDPPRPPGAHARLRDHRPPRTGHDLPRDVHPRDRSALARGRLRRAQPRPREQPSLRAAPAAAEREEYAPATRGDETRGPRLSTGSNARAQTLATDTSRRPPTSCEVAQQHRGSSGTLRSCAPSGAGSSRSDLPGTAPELGASMSRRSPTRTARAEGRARRRPARRPAGGAPRAAPPGARRSRPAAREPERPFVRERDLGIDLGR